MKHDLDRTCMNKRQNLYALEGDPLDALPGSSRLVRVLGCWLNDCAIMFLHLVGNVLNIMTMEGKASKLVCSEIIDFL